MTAQNVIIQAGGKGTRLEHYCWNKPKCLVPIDGKPLLYNLFERFPAAKFQIIAEYKADVLKRYMDVFPPGIDFSITTPTGKGTCGGLAQSLQSISAGEPIWLIWGDLIFNEPISVPEGNRPVIFLSRRFPCRWSLQPGADGSQRLEEVRSEANGVMGLFWFPDKSFLDGVPEEGEFVRWLADSTSNFGTSYCDDAEELGTLNALLNHWDSNVTTRFFNRITPCGNTLRKEAVRPEYAILIEHEVAWYDQVAALGFTNIPHLLERKPLTLTRIDGLHPHQLRWGAHGRRQILENILDALDDLHNRGTVPADATDLRAVYYDKTLARLDKVRRLQPQLAEWPTLRINGVPTLNILHPANDAILDQAVRQITCRRFTVIHGDPTFSNILIDRDNKPWFIDPRGAFAKPGIYGDPNYDWAKVYYSVVGNYDNFNRRQFILSQDGPTIEVEIRESGWSHLKNVFRDRFGADMQSIRILHALIWLALSGWVDDDYDSILAAFFIGLHHLNEAITP